tara:strand:- start:288 stop:632 length:345 start_codon:yes stop_codon:yes gene_type:complete
MYKYKVKQTRKQKYFFNLLEKELTNSYNFNKYRKALIFCLSEGIKEFSCIISDKVKISLKTYENHYTLKQFKRYAKNNPMFYLGTQSVKLSDKGIEQYYFYLIGSGNLTKLKKY